MKYEVRFTTQFKKDLKTIQKRGYNLTLLTEVIQLLADGQKLPEKTEIILSRATLPDAANVILQRIAFDL